MRATEINKGAHRGDSGLNGQWDKFTIYCPECYAHDNRPHSMSCVSRTFIKISSSARIPIKNASEKQGKLFNLKFVKRA